MKMVKNIVLSESEATNAISSIEEILKQLKKDDAEKAKAVEKAQDEISTKIDELTLLKDKLKTTLAKFSATGEVSPSAAATSEKPISDEEIASAEHEAGMEPEVKPEERVTAESKFEATLKNLLGEAELNEDISVDFSSLKNYAETHYVGRDLALITEFLESAEEFHKEHTEESI